MKKKWIKRILWACVLIASAFVLADVGLHFLSGTAWVHRQLAQQISNATGREVKLGHARLNFRGARIEDFILAKPGGLAEGAVLHIQRAVVKVSLWHLLHGHLKVNAVEVDGLSFHLVRDEQGKLNTDFSTEEIPAQTQETSGAPFNVTVQELRARDVTFIYTDEPTSLQTELKNLDVTVRNFSWDKPFEVRAKTNLVYTQNADEFSADLALTLQAALGNLDLTNAQADITSLTLRKGEMRATLSGRVENFTAPVFDLKLDGKKISSADLLPFVSQDFPFTFSQLLVYAQGNVQTELKKVTLTKAGLTSPGVQITAQGAVPWANNELDLTTKATVQLDDLAEVFPLVKPYNLGGKITLNATAATQKISAKAAWLAGKLRVAQAGDFSELQVILDGEEHAGWKDGKGTLEINGELNGEPFETKFSFTQTPKKIMANLKASARRLVLPPAEKSAKNSSQLVAQNNTSLQKSAWPLPPITAQADVQIMSLDAPYLRGNDLDFKLDMSGITPRLNQAHGTLALSIADGQITDLYHLTDSNALMKVLFMSLNVVGKVFNSLDVLSVLGGLTETSKQNEADEVIKILPDENGEMIAVKVPAHTRKVDGKLAYDKFVTDVQFDTGVATVKKGSFVSDMMSFNVSGTTNFKTEKIDMTVHAAPGKHDTDGVMPLTLKIGGTVSEPSGNMSVVGSVASLVTQGVTNNFASRAVKKSVGGFFGLFTKDDDVPQEEQPATPDELQETAQTISPTAD